MTPGDNEDWDQPIAELRDLELDPRSDLPLRVRRGIERRFFARDLLTLSWTGITKAVMEWLAMLFTGLSSERKQKEEQ